MSRILGWTVLEARSYGVAGSVRPHAQRSRFATPGPGNTILLGARFANVCEIRSGIAEMGKSAEAVATEAAKGLRGCLASPAPAGAHLADQLLLPMALAGGGVFRTVSITDHTKTNMALIEQLLPVRFTVKELSPGVREVKCLL